MEPEFEVGVNYILENDEKFETQISIFKYTDKSIAMQSSEHFGRAFSEKLIEAGGKFNGKLKIGSGWIFTNNKYPNLQALFEIIASGQIKGKVPYAPPPKTDYLSNNSSVLGAIQTEPKIVSEFKKFVTLFASEDGDMQVFKSKDKFYVWGSTEEVDTYISQSKLIKLGDFSTPDKKFAMLK
jgi:hypothetical protein